MPISGNVGALSWLAYAKESAWGTPVHIGAVAPSANQAFLPFESETLMVKTNVSYSETMKNNRAKNTFAFRGNQQTGGNIVFPFYGTIGLDFLASVLGNETQTTGSTPGTASHIQTFTDSTHITLVTGGAAAAGISVGSIVQIGAAGDTTPDVNPEVRKVTAVATDTLTLDSAMLYTHVAGAGTAGASVAVVSAPYIHVIVPSNALASFTIEKFMGVLASVNQSREYPGAVVSKYSMAFDNKGEVKTTVDLMAKTENALTGAGVSTFVAPTANPIEWSTVKVFINSSIGKDIADASWSSARNSDVESGTLAIDNAPKEEYTLSGNLYPARIVPTTRDASGKLTLFWADDTYRTDYLGKIDVGLQFDVRNASGQGALISFPEVVLTGWQAPLKIGEITTQDLDYTVLYNTTVGTDMQLTLYDTQYLQH